MAETEVIVTKFEADLTGLEKGVQEYEAALGGASKASDQFDKSAKNLGASTGALAPKFEAVKQSAERAAKASAQVTTEVKKVGNSGGFVDKLKGAFAGIGDSVKGAAGGIKNFFGGIASGVSSAVPGLGSISGGFTSMAGPIGLAATAVVGFIANFSRLDSVSTALDGVKIAFDGVLDRLTSFEGFKGLFDPRTQARDAAFAATQAKGLDTLQDLQRKVTVETAKNEIEIAKLNQQLRDRTKTDEERLRIADQLTAIETDRANREQSIIKASIFLTEREIAARKARGIAEDDLSDQLKDQLAQQQAALANAQAQSIQRTETYERRRNTITAEGEADRASLAAKGAAAQAKADAERLKLAEARAQATAKLDGIASDLAGKQLAQQQTDAEREVQAIKDKYAAIEKATAEGIAKLREVSGANEQSSITGKEAELAIQIDAAKNAELAALDKARLEAQAKTQEEAIEQLRKSLLTETEIQREAALQRLDADLLLAEQTLKTQEERDSFRIERTKQAEAELSTILTESQQAQLDAQKAALDEQVRLQEEAQTAIGTAVGESVALLIGAAAQGASVQEQAGKAIVGIFLDTLEKIVLGQALAITTGSAADGAAKAGAPGALVGLAAGAAIAAVVKGLFAIFKTQIAGAYEGEEYVGRNERPQLPGTRDRYLRRLHKGERVVTADKNREYRDELHAIHTDTYDDLIYHKHIRPAIEAMGFGDQARVNDFTSSDTGQRIAQSVMLAKFYDANIVEELKRSTRTAREQTALLAQIARNGRRNPSRW